MTGPGQKGKASDIEAEASTRSPDQRVQSAEEAVATTKAAIQSARIDRDKANFEEQEYWEEKEPGSAARGRHDEIKATSSFWKGSDWTGEEKRNLREAQAVIILALGGLSPVIASVFTFDSARDGLDAANARVKNETSAVNQGLAKSAEDTLRAATTGVATATYAYFAVLAAGVLKYYHVCEKHAENVKNLNQPEVAKHRAGLERWLQNLQQRLEAEQRELAEAIAARDAARRGSH